jgi:D-3-phosphoglycerate dehydrogenase
MRILIADKLSETTVESLRQIGADVIIEPNLAADELPQHISDVNVLIVRSTKVTAAAIDAAGQLSLIIRAGAGVNTIDVTAASSRGIYVTNCPGRNSAAVAELAIGLLIACDRRIPDSSADLRAGRWRKKEYGNAAGLRGRTLGLLGQGMIGKAVAERARGLGMKVVAWSRSLTPELAEEMGIECVDVPWKVATTDAVSVHLAYAPELKHIVGKEFLAAMKDGAILINTSRGELVDTAALKDAIREKGLRVGLDVYENEPAGGEAEFADTELAGLLAAATPHIGASTEEAAEAIAAEVVRIVREFRRSGKPPNTVNLCERTPATHSLVIRHFNRVGVLAGVLDCLREEGVNVEEMENTIFDEAKAACCTLQLDTAPSAQTISRLHESGDILQVTLEARK